MKRIRAVSTNSNLLSVFWYVDGKFIGPEEPLDGNHVVSYGDYLQLDYDHFWIWSKYSNYNHIDPRLEYDYYPRGRTLFNIKIHKFIVIGDKKIVENPRIQDKLLQYYGLPSTTIFESDEHYQSEV